jgi:hypothetical protein
MQEWGDVEEAQVLAGHLAGLQSTSTWRLWDGLARLPWGLPLKKRCILYVSMWHHALSVCGNCMRSFYLCSA